MAALSAFVNEPQPRSYLAGVYHRPDAAPLTAAAFAFGDDIGQVEEIALQSIPLAS